MKAILQSALQNLTVDREARTVTGVKLLENNRDVTYKGADGKAMGFRTNDALLKGLLAHAGNRTIPSHLTHDWADGKRDGLHSRVGGIKNCRLSDAGDLIGDYHAMPGDSGDAMLWLAENDPDHCMLSCIFDYNPIKTDSATYAVALSFDSADFVAKGAGVTALLSHTNDTDMTKEEIQAIVTDSIKAALADFKPALPANLVTTEQADERVKAALSAFKPEVSDEKMAEILANAEAKIVAKLGAGPLLQNITRANKEGDAYTAKLAEYVKVAPNRATAIGRLLKDHPELAEAHELTLRNERAQLTNSPA